MNVRPPFGFLISGNGLRWLLNLNMTFETPWVGVGQRVLILKFFCVIFKNMHHASLGNSDNSVAIDFKNGGVLR